MLLVFFAVAALPVGYLFGGRLHNYLNKPLIWPMLPAIAFLLEASFERIDPLLALPIGGWIDIAVCVEYALLAIFILSNVDSRGIILMGLGMLANFIAIASNGFCMPVSPIIYQFPDAIHIASMIESGDVIRYVLVGWDAPFWFLGDTIPLFSGLASVGDLLMGIALFFIIIFKMNTRPTEANKKHI